MVQYCRLLVSVFFFNDTATTEIYTRSIVGSVRCVQETVPGMREYFDKYIIPPAFLPRHLKYRRGALAFALSASASRKSLNALQNLYDQSKQAKYNRKIPVNLPSKDRMADVVEALIGAIFVQFGYDISLEFAKSLDLFKKF
eukprot:TRINITY_DN28372_c0_g1_i1.p1 TRINITY_DN28372_c0_g1~~TRINITY_DN28372_c0_g1_i1.p1  ORF type:complete len:142 (-),score=27.86 TRINITY_DN28372_c0_g1_i1:244-669(-)